MERGLQSAEAFRVQRCQIVLASELGAGVPRIARQVGCSEQTAQCRARVQYPGGSVSAARLLAAPHHTRAFGKRGSPAAPGIVAPESSDL